jgi:hypothetical protein
MRWTGHVAHGEKRNVKFWWENLKERGNLEDLSVYGSIILKLLSLYVFVYVIGT